MDAAASKLTNEVDDPEGREQLERARERFLAGDFAQAKVLAAAVTSLSFNKEAAAKLIDIARQREADFSPSFIQKIGLFFADPSGKIDSAEEAYEAGDYQQALDDVSAALDQWSDAQEQGLFRLSLVVGFAFAAVIGGWLLVRRIESRRKITVPVVRRDGHVLSEPGERSSSWKEWLNQKD
jgi:hypothetical protein